MIRKGNLEVQLTVYFSKAIYKNLKAFCKEADISMNKYISKLIEKDLGMIKK